MQGKVLSLIILVLLLCQSVSAQVDYNVVDDFDGYASTEELKAVWDDYFVNASGAFIYLETDPNYVRDGNSLRFVYDNDNYYKVGSYIDAQDPAELEVGADWTVGGVKALTLYFMGDPCNTIDAKYKNADRLWAELKEVGTDAGVVKHTDVNQMAEAEWHEWNIVLSDFNDAGVDLSNLDRVTIGIGGAKAGQSGAATTQDQIWIDDIRLYPPRCFPELAQVAGNLNDDCIIDVCDLQIMGREWVVSDMMASPQPPATPPIVRYEFDEGSGTIAANTGTYGSSYDVVLPGYLDANGVFGVHPNHAPVWLDDPNRGWCLSFDGEAGMWPGIPPSKEEQFLGGDYLIIPPLNLNSDTVSITAWLKPDPWLVDPQKGTYEQKGIYTGLVVNHDFDIGGEAALLYGCDESWSYNAELHYEWWCNSSRPTYKWNSNIFIPDWRWSLISLVVQPGQATLYLADVNNPTDPNDDILYEAEGIFGGCKYKFDTKTLIAGNETGSDRFFRGYMDDVRIYDYSLTAGEVMGIAGMEGIAYFPNRSVANIVPKTPPPEDYDPNNPDIVNFLDYDLMADNWLAEFLWPPE